MNMELWNEKAIEKSERILNELKKISDFVLVGGWAVYFWTKTIKSIDIDIYMNFEDFYKIQSILIEKGIFINFNPKLKKYSTKIEEVDVDIYTPDQSGLIIPCKDVFRNKWFEIIERFKVLKAEPLMLLKLDAEKERPNTIKGFKDRCDIIALVTRLDLDMKFLDDLFKKYNAFILKKRLIKIVKNSSEEYKYALQKEISPSKLKKLKKEIISKISLI
jgi:hypothetical protein